MSTSAGPTSSQVRTPNPAPERLPDRQKSWHTKEVGHMFACLSSERLGRGLGLFVVLISTAIGSTAFATLQNNPSDAAQATVAGFALVTALAAAVKEYSQFGKTSVEHRELVKKWEELTYKADHLADMLKLGIEDTESAERALTKLEAKAVQLENTPPLLHRRADKKAETWLMTGHQGTYRKA